MFKGAPIRYIGIWSRLMRMVNDTDSLQSQCEDRDLDDVGG